jgi:hypothetical protein
VRTVLEVACALLGGVCILLALAYLAGPDEEPSAEKTRTQAALRDYGKCLDTQRQLPAGLDLNCRVE